ncbi:ABC transporter ATP-binding protein [Corynebacterium cystitidis]|uniref:ABC transporter ATP-binding protein n=1 Tax=Corynebacterium cystitidis TaxID=35757 RepID=UPI00211DEE07|nr:ABC transporter ATP-binding protein [Corynebacterium cystitidis]
MTTVIETHGLTKAYGKAVVVDKLDLRIEPGRVHGLLGPNGSGKSTTMKMLLGLTTPTQGVIRLFRQELTATSRPTLLQHVGALIEQPSGYQHLTGAENMRIVARLVRAEEANVRQAVALVRMEKQMDKLVKNYSLGMKQRLGIAMALVRNPQLLILDEPTNGLDPAGIEEIRELIISLARDQGRTVLVSSHLLSEIEKMATELTIINHGRLVFSGGLDALYETSQPTLRIDTPLAQRAVDLIPELEVSAVDGALRIDGLSNDQAAEVCAQLVHAGVPIHQMVRERQSLEDIFIALTGKQGAGA